MHKEDFDNACLAAGDALAMRLGKHAAPYAVATWNRAAGGFHVDTNMTPAQLLAFLADLRRDYETQLARTTPAALVEGVGA